MQENHFVSEQEELLQRGLVTPFGTTLQDVEVHQAIGEFDPYGDGEMIADYPPLDVEDDVAAAAVEQVAVEAVEKPQATAPPQRKRKRQAEKRVDIEIEEEFDESEVDNEIGRAHV